MAGTLLLRGMLVGLLAGLLCFGFLKIVGEPQVDHAIAFETKLDQPAARARAQTLIAKGLLAPSEAPAPALVSRRVQAGIGLFTGVVVYSMAFGGLFALAFALAYGRMGDFGPRTAAVLLAALGLVAVTLVPALKYPANPPAVGEAATIGARTALYFSMMAVSLAAMIAAGMLRLRLLARCGAWSAALLAAAFYLIVVIAAGLALPSVDEVPRQFPAVVLWQFRIASLGGQAIMWTTLGLVFGALTERAATGRRRLWAETLARMSPGRRSRGRGEGSQIPLTPRRGNAKPAPAQARARGSRAGPGSAMLRRSLLGEAAMPYAAPLAEMRFVLEEVAELGDNAPADLRDAILAEAGRFAETILAPLNQSADRTGSRLENGIVRTPPGFSEAYANYVAGGWNGLALSPEHGGQGLPQALSTAVVEMWNSACMSWALCPLLTSAAAQLLESHGSAEQKRLYLGKLVSGEWTGTMNLTEPQAGSDLGAVRTRAVPHRDGNWGEHYRLTGQKIFITYGDHDLAPNIVHLVLARTPEAPAGSRGLSLFLVPKYLPDGESRPGARNGVRTLRLEEKLGIHASPTCVLAYEDAIGWRVGEENRGLPLMFMMMNNARLGVGVQGLAIAERAYQAARDFARTRIQGRPLGAEVEGLPILHHPDVRRMLVRMRAAVAAMRALSYYTAGLFDRGRDDPRGATQRRAELLIPVVKAWCTDLGVMVASTALQVHGGMGYIEETGAAQHLRDARIAPIYEGTNGIQANDLVGRKLAQDGGEAVRALIAEMRETAAAASAPDLAGIGGAVAAAIAALESATAHLLHADPAEAAAGSVPYLSLFGTVVGGWLLLRLALAARRSAADTPERAFFAARRTLAQVYAEQFLARASGLLAAVAGGRTVLDFPTDLL